MKHIKFNENIPCVEEPLWFSYLNKGPDYDSKN